MFQKNNIILEFEKTHDTIEKLYCRAKVGMKLADLSTNDIVLDVGCAWGYVERLCMIGKVKSFVGIDIESEAIKYATHKDGGYYVLGNAEKLPFKQNTFTKVLCLDVIEHVKNDEAVVHEMWRVLKKNGTLVLTCPNKFLSFLDPQRKEHRHYDIKDMNNLLRGRFKIEYVYITGLFFSCIMSYMRRFCLLMIKCIGRISKKTDKQKCKNLIRKIIDPIQDLDYRINYKVGFCLSLIARKL